MSSWIRGPRQRIRLGLHQDKPAGVFSHTEEDPVTVVSAYYEMQSKYPKENYRNWIRLFLENCACHLVFFTEADYFPFIESCRKDYADRTHIEVVNRDEWVANKEFPQGFWEFQHQYDPERDIHSPDLYKVWYEKKEFVKRAIKLNPWGHNVFVWADAGICRSANLAKLIREFPHTERIPCDRIMMLNIGEFTASDEVDIEINGVKFKGGAHGKLRMAGNVLAGTVGMWQLYDRIYDSTLNKYIQAQLFVGKDQTIMATAVLEHRQHFSLLTTRPAGPEQWAYMTLYLGAPKPVFELLTDERRNKRQRNYPELIELSQQVPLVFEAPPAPVPQAPVFQPPQPQVAPGIFQKKIDVA